MSIHDTPPKLAFITSIRYPSASANRVHMLSMVDAFAKRGLKINFLCRSIAQRKFSDLVTLVPIGTSRSITSAWKYVGFLKQQKHDFWFIREPHLLLLILCFYIVRTRTLPPLTVYEVHDVPRNIFDSIALSLLLKIKNFYLISITQSLASDLKDAFKIPQEKILVLPDGVAIDTFTTSLSKLEAKKRVGYTHKPVVVYSGSLFSWKGVYTLLQAAEKTPELEYWFLGGYEADIEAFTQATKGVPNVKVWGYVPHESVAMYLAAADVLVLPNSAQYRMSKKYTSPLKMFEYMASKRPIVASDLPSIREVLSDGVNAYLVKPDDAASLAERIKHAVSDPKNDSITSQAFADVQKYTWDVRVDRILNKISATI